jgi:DNA mismatch repair protein MutS2
MLARAYRDLEFDSILASLAGYAGSETAKARIASCEVEFGAGIARLSLAQTRDMLRLISGAQSFDGFEFGIMPDPVRLIRQAEVGEVWGKDDIKAFRDLLDSFARVDEMSRHSEQMGLDALLDACRAWAPTDDLRKEFRRIFNSDCEVKDTASTELRRIRGKLREAEAVAASHVRGAIAALGGGDEIHLSIRNQRLVINVPRGFTHRVPGIVVDTSASGASVYFEPTDLIPLNNDRLELFLDEEMEVNRIVLGYEGRVARRAEEIARNFEIAVDLDFIHARARYARALKGVEPDLDDSCDTVIARGVFPLMVGRFVPEDISFASPHKALVVSGVNAGGKTVLLKLIGTFVLMAQMGCFVPAASARLGVFSAVYTDIGEEQSTATDLSTFTSHLKFLRAIEERMTDTPTSRPPALVLMDEIGTGTEPTEGASLAYAVVSHLLDKNVRLVVTTHYDLIKGMAVKFPTVKNVSLGFDLVNLEPTFKVVDGQPGLSFARQIARRFGIPESILAQAEAVLDRKDAELADIIARLADMKQAQMDALSQARAEGEKAAKITAEMDAKRKAFLADARRLKDELKLKISQLVAQTKDALRAKIEQAPKTGKSTPVIPDVYRAVEKVSDEAAEEISDALAELGIEEEVVKSTRPPVVGDLVMWRESRVRGRVHELNEAKRTAVVLVAGKRLKANLEDLSVIEVSPKGEVQSKPVLSHERPELDLAARDVQGISQIIDLHGMKAEEAIAALTDYFDHLPLTDFTEVRILHGIGGGILRKVTREFLMRHPLVEGFKGGESYEGGVGATVVRLKKE